MMKNLYTRMFAAAAVLLAVTLFTSCDRDREEAFDLTGEWYGDFGMYYYDGYMDESYWAYETDLRFIPEYEYATHGSGEEVDLFAWPCPIRYQCFLFYWQVRNGIISLHYPFAPELDVEIYDYHLNYNYFSGYIGDTPFRLMKLVGAREWYGYNYGDGYGYGGYYDGGYNYGYGRYYVKGRDGATKAEDIPVQPNPENFRFGRSFGEKKAVE